MTTEEHTPTDKSKRHIELNPDIEAELSDILRAGAEPETTAPRIDLPKDPTFEEEPPSLSTDIFDNPANTSDGVMKTVVTDREREAFLEALLHEKPFTLDIPVLKDSTVTIRSRSVYEQSLAYECTSDLPKEDFRNKDLLLWVQRFSMATGLVAINGEPYSSLRLLEGTDSHEDNKKQLEEFVRERFLNMPYVKWQMLLSAFNVFTMKEKILLDEVVNRDFWNPVD